MKTLITLSMLVLLVGCASTGSGPNNDGLFNKQAGGKWSVRSWIDPMSDVEVISIRLNAENYVLAPYKKNQRYRPTMWFTCLNNSSRVAIDVGSIIDGDQIEERFGSAERTISTWDDRDDYASSDGGDIANTMIGNEMLGNTRLLLRVPTYRGGYKDALFNFTGIKDISDKIRKVCGWESKATLRRAAKMLRNRHAFKSSQDGQDGQERR